MYKSSEKDGSKYVAEILSSMANGARPSSAGLPRYSFQSPNVTHTTSTPNLTPTTLSNIEQQFMELQQSSARSHDLTVPQSGFVPPLRTGSSAEQSPSSSLDQAYSDGEWVPSQDKRPRLLHSNDNDIIYSMSSQRKPRRRRDEQLSPEEEQRRMVRRERNKVAAAKCRQRRVDHTNRLITETEQLRDEQGTLEAEILKLQQQKDQFEFVLQAHKQVCTVDSEPVIKREFPDHYTSTTSASPLLTYDTPYQSSPRSHHPQHHGSDLTVSRPTSLSLLTNPSNSSSVSTAIGISITTPSSGFFNFSNVDGFVDGSTGLTPMNSNPCGREMAKRKSTDSSSPENGLASPSLITLR